MADEVGAEAMEAAREAAEMGEVEGGVFSESVIGQHIILRSKRLRAAIAALERYEQMERVVEAAQSWAVVPSSHLDAAQGRLFEALAALDGSASGDGA